MEYEVKGYKAFNYDATNRYGTFFAEGKTYHADGEIVFGTHGNGFHMCKHLSDVFRFVNAQNENVIVAEVTGRGKYVRRDDLYYGYFDMYCFENLTVDRFLTREEIIQLMLASPPHEVMKFLATCYLSEEETILFARKFRNDMSVIKTLLYHHYGYKDIFKTECSTEECLRLVLKDG